MTMAMISPSGREVSPAEQPRQNPRLVPPRFRLVARGVSSKKMAYDFFSHRKTSYSRRWPSEGHQGAHEVGGRAQGGRARPPSWAGCGPPGEVLVLNVFIYLENIIREVSGLLELCRIGL